MPTYLFLNTETGEKISEFMTITEMEGFLASNPNMQPLMNGAPSIGDSIRLGLRKPDSSFRDRLKEIKKHHSKGLSRSSINTFD